jgi:hypothetical protein
MDVSISTKLNQEFLNPYIRKSASAYAMYPARRGRTGLAPKEAHVLSLSKALVALSAVAFMLAVVTNFVGVFLTTSEGYSRASANLGILAIALVYCFRSDRP